MSVKIAQPKVYVVAMTSLTDQLDRFNEIDEEGNPPGPNEERIETLREFLESEGCSHEDDIWQRAGIDDEPTDGDSDLDLLPEIAGRVCYSSYGRKKDTNQRYIGHIIEVGHGCYDAETQVLTRSGWKDWTDIRDTDEFATRTKDGRLEYHYPTRLINYHHSGDMYRVETRGVDLLVTPDHKMLACVTTTREGRKRQNFELIKATELDTKSHCYVKSAEWEGPKPNVKYHPEYQQLTRQQELATIKLLGFAIGDGSIDQRGAQVKFHLRRERKIAWLTNVCAEAGLDLHANPNADRYTVTVRNIDNFRAIYNADGEKQIPLDLTRLNKEECLALYEGLISSDGHNGRTGDSFDTTSEILVDQFQQLCLHCGFAANVCYTYGPDERPTSYGDKPLTRLSVIRRELKPEVNKYSAAVGKTSWVKNWEGEVFCAEVPNNTLYVRRNGIPVWSGNSVLEHSNITLAFVGISRTLSHELVRHRAGFGYSQRSQRFVNEEDFQIVIPPLFTQPGWEELSGLVEEAAEASLEHYKRIAEMAMVKLSTPEALVNFAIREGYLTPKEYPHRSGTLSYPDQLIVNDAAFLEEEWNQPASKASWIAYLTHSGDGQVRKNFQKATSTARRKTAREAARSVLPNATETKIFVTGNLRAWRTMLDQRASIHADREIRRLAMMVLKALKTAAPNVFGDYEIKLDIEGMEYAETKHRKV